jgi:hypothetical protein
MFGPPNGFFDLKEDNGFGPKNTSKMGTSARSCLISNISKGGLDYLRRNGMDETGMLGFAS